MSAIWTAAEPTARFGLTVKHRSGAVSYLGSMSLEELEVRHDGDGLRIELSVDPASFETRSQADPRWSDFRFPFVAGEPLRFVSSRAVDLGRGRFRVDGELSNGGHTLEVGFVARFTSRRGALVLTVTAAADHRALGVTWLAGGPLKAVPELVVRTDLVPVRETAPPAVRRARTNERYRLGALRRPVPGGAAA